MINQNEEPTEQAGSSEEPKNSIHKFLSVSARYFGVVYDDRRFSNSGMQKE